MLTASLRFAGRYVLTDEETKILLGCIHEEKIYFLKIITNSSLNTNLPSYTVPLRPLVVFSLFPLVTSTSCYGTPPSSLVFPRQHAPNLHFFLFGGGEVSKDSLYIKTETRLLTVDGCAL